MAGNVPNTKGFKTSDYISKFLKLAQTSQYFVYFGLGETSAKKTVLGQLGSSNTSLKNFLFRNIVGGFKEDSIGMLCSEASLPGNSFATTEVSNDFYGVTQKFPYRKIYNDLELTFYVDSNYNIIKFFENWMSFIASPNGWGQAIQEGGSEASFRFHYPANYKCNIFLQKFEKDLKSNSNYVYRFVNAFPFDITSMPVSYDSSDILKCSVTFAYDRYIADPDGKLYGSQERPVILNPQKDKSVPNTANEILEQGPNDHLNIGNPALDQFGSRDQFGRGAEGTIGANIIA